MKQTDDALDAIIKKQTQAEKKLQQSQAAQEIRSKKRRDTENQVLTSLQSQKKVVKDNLSLFDKKGNRYSPDEVTQRQSKLAGALKGLPIEFDIAKSVDNLQSQLKTSLKDFKISLTFDVSDLEKQLGEKLNTPREIFTGRETVSKEIDESRVSGSVSQRALPQIAKLRGEIIQTNRDADALQRSIFRIPLSGEATQSLDSFQVLLAAVSQESNITSAQIQKLKEHLAALKESTTGFDNWGFTQHAIEFSKALNKLKEIEELQSQIKPDTSALERMNLILGQSATHSASIKKNLEAGSKAFPQTSNVQHHAAGGLARGTDTIPAMLSPGEFVVNARSSRQFYSELTAINSGTQPIYRENGGPVDNSVHIGDVSISAPTKTMSARDIASALNREIRRGSAKLR